MITTAKKYKGTYSPLSSQPRIYGEYDEDFDDWIQALIKEEEIELIKEER